MPSISKVTRGRGRRKKKSFLAFLANKAFKNIDVLSQITPFHKPNGGRNKLTHLQLTLSWCVLPLCVKIQYSPKLLKYKRGGGADWYMLLRWMKKGWWYRNPISHMAEPPECPSEMRTLSLGGQTAGWTHLVPTALYPHLSPCVYQPLIYQTGLHTLWFEEAVQ